MDIESALKTIGDWISKETESRKYPKGELLGLSESLQALKTEIARQSVKSEEVAEPTTRKNRTVEEAAISKTETTGCEWCEKTGKYAGFAYATFFEQTAPDEEYECSVECNYCPNCGRKLN